MQDFSIAISGLSAAQAGLEVVGNNIANAATDGYHRQRVELAPLPHGQTAAQSVGAGVDVMGVTRLVDGLLEREITRQESANGQVSQELSILSSVETMFGEFAGGGGLNAVLDGFFDSLRGLAAHPLERVWREQTVSSAEALAGEFRRLGTSLMSLEGQIALEAQNTVDAINSLTTQIAELNAKIQTIEVGGGHANNLCDQRDQRITELAKLAGVEVRSRDNGVVDVSIAGLAVVTGSIGTSLVLTVRADQSLGVAVTDGGMNGLDVQGGRLAGLIALKNDVVGGLHHELDTLANAIIDQVNRTHVQGLGQGGSYAQLTGWIMDDGDLGSDPSLTDGTFQVRLTNTATGSVERHAVDVNVSGPSPDTLESMAAKIDAIAGLSASVVSSRLNIVADPGYTFDFLPALLTEPEATSFSAVSPPTISVGGIYSGADNQTFTFTVEGSGAVGNGVLQLNVTDANGDRITVLNIGAGYAAGDPLDLPNGLTISVSRGELNAGDHFEVAALAVSDTSGFLAAAGMNTFFSGSGAVNMEVCREIADAPDRIATAFGSEFTDNAAALRLAAIRDETVDSLDGMTPGQYYQRTIADLGQQIALKQSRQDNIEAMIQDLEKRRNEISSVNINDEAALLLVFEKVFQAAAKYLSTVQTTITALMDLV